MTEYTIESASFTDADHVQITANDGTIVIVDDELIAGSLQEVVESPRHFKLIDPRDANPCWVARRHPSKDDRQRINGYLRGILGTHPEKYSENLGFGDAREGVYDITNNGDIQLNDGRILRRTRRWLDKGRGDSTIDWWLIDGDEFHQISQPEAEWILLEQIEAEKSA